MSDPKMFSDGLITPFIDAAQQQRKVEFLRRVRDRHAKTGHIVTYPSSDSCWFCLTEEALNSEAEVTRLTQEHERLKAALGAVKDKIATTLVDEEYQSLLRWRRIFLDCEDVEPEKLRPPQNQLICYAIADAMTLREVILVLDEVRYRAWLEPV